MRTASPGPGKRLALHDRIRKTEHRADSRTSSLKSRRSGSIETEHHVFGQSADVMMRLDLMAGFGSRRLGFDHVGIERALHEKLHVGNLLRFFLEDRDELVSDPHALFFGIRDAGEPREEAFCRIDRR